MSELVLRNRQRVRALNTSLLREIALALLREHFRMADFELGIHLIGAKAMARLNEGFLNHSGSTDVITFDHAGGDGDRRLHGEIFISVADAVLQARQFGTSWQAEIVRYLIHGLLHLRGYDDLRPAARRVMKRAENRLLRRIAGQFSLPRLARAKARSRFARAGTAMGDRKSKIQARLCLEPAGPPP